MRSWCLLFAVLIFAFQPALARAKSPAYLTQNELHEGWIMLFDGETDYGWQQRGNSKWTVKDSALEASGGVGMLSTTTEFADFELRAECWIDEKANSGIFLRCPTTGSINSDNAYEVNVYDKHKQWPTGSINNVAKRKGKVASVGRWSKFHILAFWDHLVVSIDDKQVLDERDAKHRRGAIALQYNGEGTVRFRNISLRPLGVKSLFNGRDLTGWQVVPEHKSVFSVTKEGWLNVKNGNGDLQTESQWGDFVLQMEVISNGDHLNSGVFYRAIPGAFWSGYENQIRNQWTGDDRTKAVDYGTGGIYNRQPARKVVSTDREWFTDTLIATGLHMAVWINGYQVSDFTDTRPTDETNARKGARTKAGVFSIQGHDPTTDLSFRNINAVEYPAAVH